MCHKTDIQWLQLTQTKSGWQQISLGYPLLGETYTYTFYYFHVAVYNLYVKEFKWIIRSLLSWNTAIYKKKKKINHQIPPFLKHSYIKIWPWNSKVEVMDGVNGQSHIVDLTSYQFISLLFHVNQTIHSGDMAWHPDKARTWCTWSWSKIF